MAGIILLSRVNSGQPGAGTGYEMDIITACVLGGISVTAAVAMDKLSKNTGDRVKMKAVKA